jgi:hypothetical protein
MVRLCMSAKPPADIQKTPYVIFWKKQIFGLYSKNCDENLRLIASDEWSREEHAARTQMHEKQAGLSRSAGMRDW